MERSRGVIAQMLAAGQVHRCYMTGKELDALRAEQMARGEKPRYDGRWRPERSEGKTPPEGIAPVLRFRNPDTGVVGWDDGVKGRIEFANTDLSHLSLALQDA